MLGDFVPMGVGQALGVRGGGNSLDNTLRIVKLVPTDWVLLDIQAHAVERGFGHGLVHMFAEDGTLLATASQSCIMRYWRRPEADPVLTGRVRSRRAQAHRRSTRAESGAHTDRGAGWPRAGAIGYNGAMTLPVRPGMTAPLPGPLHTHRDKLAELADLGYTDIWSAEADGADAFTPLATGRGVGAPPAPRHGDRARPTPARRRAWPRASPRWPTPRPGGSPSASGRRAT